MASPEFIALPLAPPAAVVRYNCLRQHGQSTAMIFCGFNGKPLLSGARNCSLAKWPVERSRFVSGHLCQNRLYLGGGFFICSLVT